MTIEQIKKAILYIHGDSDVPLTHISHSPLTEIEMKIKLIDNSKECFITSIGKLIKR